MSEGTEYLANALVWSAIGLLIGLILGTGIKVKFFGWKLHDKDRDRVIGSILVLVALFSIVNSLAFQRAQKRITDCQTRYNVAFQTVLRYRAELSDRDRRNTNQMVIAVLGAKEPGDARKALEVYVSTNKQLDAERADAKLPNETGDTCERK